MDLTWDLLREAGQAFIGLLAMPYFYIAVLLVAWHAKLGSSLQRKLFHVRLYGTLYLTLTRVLAGLAIGAVLSVASLGTGAKLSSSTLLCVWIAMGVLAVFRLRFLCLAYAAGALGLLQALLKLTGSYAEQGVWADAAGAIADIDVPSLLFLAGVLHIGEGILVRLQSAKHSIPLFLEGKRGKPLGGHALSGLWPIPLLWFIPAGAGSGVELPWTPLFGLDDGAMGWSFLAFPVLIGFSDRTSTYWPEMKARTSGNMLVLYGVLLAGLAAGAAFWSPLGVIAAIAAIALHEGLLLIGRFREEGRTSIFSQDGSGVRVLAVLPGTPAAEMDFKSGEIIRKINGAVVRNKEELHAALQRQSAFSKLEVVNREGHVRFVQRAKYAGEHYQLGLILAPDEDAEYVASPRSASIWQSLRGAGALYRGPSQSMIARSGDLPAAIASSSSAIVHSASLSANNERSGESPSSAARLAELPAEDAAELTVQLEDAERKQAAAVEQGDNGLPPRKLK